MHISSVDSVDDMRITHGDNDQPAAAPCTKAKRTVKAVDVMLDDVILDVTGSTAAAATPPKCRHYKARATAANPENHPSFKRPASLIVLQLSLLTAVDTKHIRAIIDIS